MVHLEANDGAAAFYLLVLLTVFIMCLVPFLVVRAAQRAAAVCVRLPPLTACVLLAATPP